MAVDTFSESTILAILSIGRDPSWVSGGQVVSSGDVSRIPQADQDGASLADSPTTYVDVKMRLEAHRRTAYAQVTTYVQGDTLTVSINGNTVAFDTTSNATLDLAMAAFAAAINAAGNVNSLVSAVAVRKSDDSTEVGVRDAVKITGDADADYTFDFTRTGSGVIVGEADAALATVRIWTQAAGAAGVTPPTGWRRQQESYAIDGAGGFFQRFDTAAVLRMFVQLDGLDGMPGDGSAVTVRAPDVSIGPAVVEATT